MTDRPKPSGSDPVNLSLSLRVAADFADMFVVRGMRPGRRGRLHDPRWRGGRWSCVTTAPTATSAAVACASAARPTSAGYDKSHASRPVAYPVACNPQAWSAGAVA
jgi:N-terminal domain of (some) glycogen debranching enzymes